MHALVLFRCSIIVGHQRFQQTIRRLIIYNFELSIIIVYIFFFNWIPCFALKILLHNIMPMIDRSMSLMEWWLISFPRLTVHVRKFSSWRPMNRNRLCNRSSIGSAKPMIGCENRADSKHCNIIHTYTIITTSFMSIVQSWPCNTSITTDTKTKKFCQP